MKIAGFNLNKITGLLLSLWLVIFPFSVRLLVYEKDSYDFGMFNPWVSEFLYAPELILWIIFGLWIIENRKKLTLNEPKYYQWIAAFLGNVFLISLIMGEPIHGAFLILRTAEVWMMITLLKAKLIPVKHIIRYLSIGLLIQIAWATAQWFHNGSIGLLRLGESIIGPDIAGVAKNDLADGTKHIRAYGSFLHPNILGAYIVILLSIIWGHLKKESRWVWGFLTAWSLWIIGSLAAWIAAAALVIWKFTESRIYTKAKLKKIFIGIVILIGVVNAAWFAFTPTWNSDDSSLTERQAQIEISQTMTLKNPIGIGWDQFTNRMSEATDTKLMPWQHVPVHNTYYLVLNELGIQGLILLGILIGLTTLTLKPEHAAPWILVLLLASMDHLLLTSWTGMMMIAITLFHASHLSHPKHGRND